MTPLIYVAGPYRGASVAEVDENIRRAREWGRMLARCGAYPVIPHSNTAFFDGLAPDELFLEGTLELLRRCDGAVFIPGWRLSSGARREYDEAVKLGLMYVAYQETPSPEDRVLVNLVEYVKEQLGGQPHRR